MEFCRAGFDFRRPNSFAERSATRIAEPENRESDDNDENN
jgi:hypothetical protein